MLFSMKYSIQYSIHIWHVYIDEGVFIHLVETCLMVHVSSAIKTEGGGAETPMILSIWHFTGMVAGSS